eukprot:2497990-Amphidinium_carterae.3
MLFDNDLVGRRWSVYPGHEVSADTWAMHNWRTALHTPVFWQSSLSRLVSAAARCHFFVQHKLRSLKLKPGWEASAIDPEMSLLHIGLAPDGVFANIISKQKNITVRTLDMAIKGQVPQDLKLCFLTARARKVEKLGSALVAAAAFRPLILLVLHAV